MDIPENKEEEACPPKQKSQKAAEDADLFEVDTVESYSADYTACTEEAAAELRQKACPELREYLDSIDEYDNIVVAGPGHLSHGNLLSAGASGLGRQACVRSDDP